LEDEHLVVDRGVAVGIYATQFGAVEVGEVPDVGRPLGFLTRVNLMRAYAEGSKTPLLHLHGKSVAVFGGGNTAMDAVRTVKRLGAASAQLLYRRSQEEMPARDEEIAHALAEGIELETPVEPVELLGDNRTP
jgi:glutamate synthase (NADPH/NADH) small chain